VIVGFQPGGSVKDARVVLRPDETVPTRYNVPEAVVYREDADTHEWLMVKPKFSVLPSDSPLLSQPKLPEVELFSLTSEENSDSLYEHQDIIRLDEEESEILSHKEEGDK
jgi:hypothetical protein